MSTQGKHRDERVRAKLDEFVNELGVGARSAVIDWVARAEADGLPMDEIWKRVQNQDWDC